MEQEEELAHTTVSQNLLAEVRASQDAQIAAGDEREDFLSPVTAMIALNLFNALQKRGVIDAHSLVGGDGWEGISVRWPQARMFCEIYEGLFISLFSGGNQPQFSMLCAQTLPPLKFQRPVILL